MKITHSFSHQQVQGYKFGSWPFGQPKMYSHCYIIDGMLIDTGHYDMRKEIITMLLQYPIQQIFITHHHEDHTGNLDILQKKLNCPSYASASCVEIMKSPPSISFGQWLTWGDRNPNFDLTPKEKSIATEHYNFQIIPVPGHAPDMVCLLEANEGWLFSSDLFVSEYIRYFLHSESMQQQIESIRKVLQYDFEIMFCGHNPQFKNCKQKLKNKLDFFLNFYGQVADLYHKGHSADSIFKEMKLKDHWHVRLISFGAISTMNMVKSVIRDEINATS